MIKIIHPIIAENTIIWIMEFRKIITQQIMNIIKTPLMNHKIIRTPMPQRRLGLSMCQKSNILHIILIRMMMNTKRGFLVYRRGIRIYNLILKKKILVNKNRNKDPLSWINFLMLWAVVANND